MSLIDKARESEINSYFKLEEDYQSLVDHAQDLERQLAEANKIAENALDRWCDTDTYGACTKEIQVEYDKLDKLKGQGDE